ncbi:hypothetical protein HY345_03130 [Candidatus Microgenomates bacterium]|nr:hypothetical protein [Candidatus Microgenomates bacterium]
MKNKLLLLLASGVVAVLVITYYFVGLKVVVQKEPKSLGAGATDFNLVDSMTLSATSTVANASGDPVKVLSRNYNRIYAVIQNDSDTDIYLWPQNFANIAAASSTVSATGSLKLTPGGHLELLPENMIITDVWATSTLGNKRILFLEK